MTFVWDGLLSWIFVLDEVHDVGIDDTTSLHVIAEFNYV